MRKLIAEHTACTVREMIAALEELVSLPGPHTLDTTYISINSDSVRLELVEEKLTDGSKVYNIELMEVSK